MPTGIPRELLLESLSRLYGKARPVMDRSIIPSVPLELDKRRYLRFSNWARCQAERAICDFWQDDRLSVYEVLTRNPIRANDIAIIFWEALKEGEEDPSITLREAMNLMDYAPLADLLDAVLKSWNIATPQETPPADSTGAPDPFDRATTSASTGQPSGPTAALS
jgi:hypothetical protein